MCDSGRMETKKRMVVRSGGGPFGSGWLSAGWEVLDGVVESTPIPGTDWDDGSMRSRDYLLWATTPSATVRVWCDGLLGSGIGRRRSRGLEAVFELRKA